MNVTTAPDPGVAESPPRIHLSAEAQARIREMLDEEELLPEGGLRISARLGAGCSAPTHYSLLLEPFPEPDDVILQGDGVRIFLDPRSAWGLDGLHVDWVDSPVLGSGFAFRRAGCSPGGRC